MEPVERHDTAGRPSLDTDTMRTRTHLAASILALLALVAAACARPAEPGGPSVAEQGSTTTNQTVPPAIVDAGTSPTPSGTRPSSEASTSAVSEAPALPTGPSALEHPDHPDLPAPLVDVEDIVPGGPPPDGIPAVDEPKFLPVGEHPDLLSPREPVVSLEIDGDARAYPVRVMIWHEIVNDVVGGIPVAVTYCPLCNSASTYVREIRGVETTFGTSGRLYLSALVMYDRATESLWTHYDGRAVAGVLAGEKLERIASPMLSWGEFVAAYPDGLVLDETRTGYQRAYGRNPYVGYDNPDLEPFLFREDPDARAAAMQRIVGVTRGDETRAYTLAAVSGGEARATNDVVGGDHIAIFWKAGQVSALDVGDIGEGRDVGSVAVFLAALDGEILTFTTRDGEFVDVQTGSSWNLVGEAISGPLAGSRLVRVAHLDTFWFAWAAYRPETTLVTAAPG